MLDPPHDARGHAPGRRRAGAARGDRVRVDLRPATRAERRQAALLTAAYRRLAALRRSLRIASADWYMWSSPDIGAQSLPVRGPAPPDGRRNHVEAGAARRCAASPSISRGAGERSAPTGAPRDEARRSRLGPLLAAALALGPTPEAVAAALAVPGSSGRRSTPGPWPTPGRRRRRSYALMRASGVGTVRIRVSWRLQQPGPPGGPLPRGGSAWDRCPPASPRRTTRCSPPAGSAARHRGGERRAGVGAPRSRGARATPRRGTVRRVRRRAGSSLPPRLRVLDAPRRAGRARARVDGWEVWTEPNLLRGWVVHPLLPYDGRTVEGAYARLLAATHGAVRAADPRARVLVGALAARSWAALDRLYRLGGRGTFDGGGAGGLPRHGGRGARRHRARAPDDAAPR